MANGNMIVFGTGYVSRAFMKALEIKGESDRVSLFIEAKRSGRETFFGRPVMSLREYKERFPESRDEIIIAVHDVSAENAERALNENGLAGKRIYPVLNEMLYGKPLFENTEVATGLILKQQDPGEYWLDIRYGALLSIKGEDGDGEEIYKKAIALSSSRNTAENRFERFRKLIGNIDENGFDPEKPVDLDEDLRIIDGLHRIAAALYKGNESMRCRIFASSPVYKEVIDDSTRITEEVLNSGAFTEWEIGKIKKYREYRS